MRTLGIFSAALGVIVFLGGDLRADTVILKSGEKVEGKVLSETDTELTVSVQITPTIKDERVIKKTDVEKIDKVMPDEIAWAPLAGLTPGDDSLEKADYDQVITALGYFLSSFPASPHAKAAKERLELFQVDQKRIERGEVKMDGTWLGKEKVEEERIQIVGHILFNRMKAHAAAGRLIEAMLVFDQIEKGFSGSASYSDAISLGRQVIVGLKPAVEQQQARVKRKIEDDKVRLKTAQGAEKVLLVALLKREQAATDAAVTAMEKSGAKWLPLYPSNERSLSATLARLNSETTRLNTLPVEKIELSFKKAEDAAAELASGKLADAEKTLNEATTAWSKNEVAERLKKKLTEAKKAEADAKAEAAKTKAQPTPKPKSTPAPRSAQAPVEAAKEPEAVPFYKKPFFFVALVSLAVFGAIGAKVFAKLRATERDEAGH